MLSDLIAGKRQLDSEAAAVAAHAASPAVLLLCVQWPGHRCADRRVVAFSFETP